MSAQGPAESVLKAAEVLAAAVVRYKHLCEGACFGLSPLQTNPHCLYTVHSLHGVATHGSLNSCYAKMGRLLNVWPSFGDSMLRS